MKTDETINRKSPWDNGLEPRVAKLEVGLDRLTEDVKDLANVVRVHGQTVEQEIQKLVIAVTQASGPKKTDWSTIFAGVMLIMALGSAVYLPLNQKMDSMGQVQKELQIKSEQHSNLPGHPVSMAIEQQLQSHISLIEEKMVKQAERDNEELHLWRQKAMGLKPQK